METPAPREFHEPPADLDKSLAQDLEAMARFESLDRGTQRRIIRYVQTGSSGGETDDRVRQAVDFIRYGDWSYWS